MREPDRSFGKFLFLWSGELVSAIGSGLTAFGLGVYVFRLTGRVSASALVTLLAFAPSLVLSPVAGVLADRYDRRLLMVLGDGLSALGLGYILLCMFRGGALLWQVCAGVSISAVFSSLLEPAYKATVTDLLTREQYAKASGLVQTAASAKFLISPILAGYLLAVSDIRLLLALDIGTFALTAAATLIVRRGLAPKSAGPQQRFLREFREGWTAVSGNRGILALVVLGSGLTFFLGVMQTLAGPMILSFADSSVLGTTLSLSASGMLVTGVIIGITSIKSAYRKVLSVSLFLAGTFMAAFGLRENIALIRLFGFLFFAMLPVANACLDYLLRSNIDNEVQGRAWGLIGLISQAGYVFAYGTMGVLADRVFTPLMANGGPLAAGVGRILGTGDSRGMGLLIVLSGLLLSVTAVGFYVSKPVASLEVRRTPCIAA